jgi:hypothetical protein
MWDTRIITEGEFNSYLSTSSDRGVNVACDDLFFFFLQTDHHSDIRFSHEPT